MKVYQKIASAIDARLNCQEKDNAEWFDRWSDTLEELEHELPWGSGFDSGTTINLEKSRVDRIVLDTGYHHMDEWGMYCGWSDHSVIVTPSLHLGYNLRVTGRNVRDIKDYIGDTFAHMLDSDID